MAPLPLPLQPSRTRGSGWAPSGPCWVGRGLSFISIGKKSRAGPPPAPHPPPRASLGEGVPDDPLQKPLPSSHLHPRETRGTPARGSGAPDAMSARSCGREPQGPGPATCAPPHARRPPSPAPSRAFYPPPRASRPEGACPAPACSVPPLPRCPTSVPLPAVRALCWRNCQKGTPGLVPKVDSPPPPLPAGQPSFPLEWGVSSHLPTAGTPRCQSRTGVLP